MSDWADNLEEKFSSTDKYSRVCEARDTLEVDEVECPVEAGSIEITYYEQVPTRKRQSTSRSVRLSNACAILSAAADAARSRAEEDPDEELDSDALEELTTFADDLDDVVSGGRGNRLSGHVWVRR